jgi:ferric enterobactin receptor
MKSYKKSVYLIIVIVAMLLIEKRATSQTDPVQFKVYGEVADSVTKKLLDNITINLFSVTNTSLKTILTKTDGSFMFSGLGPLKYFIEITAVGYFTKTIIVDFTNSSANNRDLGKVNIINKVSILSGVVVTAKTPLVKQEIDRVIYDMLADPESKGNSVLTIMRKVPFLSVDGDENILLNGSSGYKILINGKPSGMVERNPKDILHSMPASTIKSIEVITNPSSKYDAEGLAGIINIITNKKMDNGYNGTINMSKRFPVGGPGAGGSFTFKQNKLGISAFAGASLYSSPKTSTGINRKTTGINATNLSQNNISQYDSKSAYFGSELGYEIDSLHLISGLFNVSGSSSNGIGHQSSLLYKTSAFSQAYDLTNNNEGNGKGFDAALNYQLGFKTSKQRLLTISYRYINYTNQQYNNLGVSRLVNYLRSDYNQSNEGISSEQTLQVDYVHPVKKLNIEAGIKGIFRTNKSNFQYWAFDPVSGRFELDPSRTNKFTNEQNIFGAYNTYQFNLKNWGFKGGLRIEETIIDANFISKASMVKQNYLSIIPSVNISRKFKNMSSLTLAYTNRIQRPGINQLNPFVDRSNPDFETTGNPNLKPAYTNIFLVTYNKSKKATLNLALSYMLSNNAIGPVSTYEPSKNITLTSDENIGKVSILKANIYMNYPITKTWNFSLNSDVRYASASVMVKGVLVKNEGLMEYANASTSYRFPKGWRINADATVKSGGISKPQSKANGFVSSSFGMQKDLVKDRFTFSAAINNPTSKYRINRDEIKEQYLTQIFESKIYFRSFSISLNYRFGKLKDAIKKNKRGINNDDVSNSNSN